jgi:hypothetical protein
VQRVDAVCPRCGWPPAVRVRVTGNAATVTLNLRCEPCYRRGLVVFYDVVVYTLELKEGAQ